MSAKVSFTLIMTYLLTSHVDGANERAGLLRLKGIKNKVVEGGNCYSYEVYTTDDCSGSSQGQSSAYPMPGSVKDGCDVGDGVSFATYCDADGYHYDVFLGEGCEGDAYSKSTIPNGCGENPFGDGFAKLSCGPCPTDVTESSV
mmetsp:Transcript_41237/g.50170  ORF Transcript_41237/g.50170 Transcript_41237/m.50170 type:complete len:144 (-) Transcript_41237:105-536(-)|eukprot:CAMPEP_0172505374 /NCGR_PEP_ID=MMETSP1066-20121228/185935_1 /TAXON_ID=671091 /ORGANISM="Coscinodiscus wailesii, Strain CCMP2513" /LENGTH=143 /DNA_ID=CAMNT_0013281953 /DNA_START=91 /DNA_END=522 /DNA_ORIENTATION=+